MTDSRLAIATLFVALLAAPRPGAAQSAPDSGAHQHDMSQMNHEPSMVVLPARDGSGTAWLPDESPMYAAHRQRGPWTFMVHGNAFLQYLKDSGDRGREQTGSVNWLMLMADREAGGGHVGLRTMFSLEPWTIAGCGYPDLLASGETCEGQGIHDRQHPHDLFMEIAATYDRRLTNSVRWQVYGGPAGEPALGPVGFPHRVSAMPSPLAPITHHWFDATHITFGVVTAGVYGARWKAESSVFNGREPDEYRTGLDLGALDSWSGRLWWLPADRWAFQVSAGRLKDAEAAHDGDGRVDITRITSSGTYHRLLPEGGIWATTFGWARNQEPGRNGTHGLLIETNLTLRDRDTWFARAEWSQKPGHDLELETSEVFDIAKIQAAYTRFFTGARSLKPGVGAGVSIGFVPASLAPVYGRRANAGVSVYLTLRAPAMLM